MIFENDFIQQNPGIGGIQAYEFDYEPGAQSQMAGTQCQMAQAQSRIQNQKSSQKQKSRSKQSRMAEPESKEKWNQIKRQIRAPKVNQIDLSPLCRWDYGRSSIPSVSWPIHIRSQVLAANGVGISCQRGEIFCKSARM
jgi:hypothetical protein